MRVGLLAIPVSLLLSGCDFLTALLPRQTTTAGEARQAISRCGGSPESMAWRVTDDGALAFGRKSADARPIADEVSECLLRWARTNRVEVRFIGWETSRPNVTQKESAAGPAVPLAGRVTDAAQIFSPNHELRLAAMLEQL